MNCTWRRFVRGLIWAVPILWFVTLACVWYYAGWLQFCGLFLGLGLICLFGIFNFDVPSDIKNLNNWVRAAKSKESYITNGDETHLYKCQGCVYKSLYPGYLYSGCMLTHCSANAVKLSSEARRYSVANYCKGDTLQGRAVALETCEEKTNIVVASCPYCGTVIDIECHANDVTREVKVCEHLLALSYGHQALIAVFRDSQKHIKPVATTKLPDRVMVSFVKCPYCSRRNKLYIVPEQAAVAIDVCKHFEKVSENNGKKTVVFKSFEEGNSMADYKIRDYRYSSKLQVGTVGRPHVGGEKHTTVEACMWVDKQTCSTCSIAFQKSMGCNIKQEATIQSAEQEATMEEAKYAAVNTLTGESIDQIALMEFTDDRRSKHVEAIKARNDMIHAQMVELAKDLFTISMYRRQNLVTIDNCKMAVELSLISPTNSEKGRLIVNLYLNKTSKNDKRLNWKDIINSMASERENQSVISSIRELGKKRRIPEIFSKKASLFTSYEVTRQWSIVYRNFNQDFVRLLPTARMLVDEQLSILYSDAKADTEYLQAMFTEIEEVIG